MDFIGKGIEKKVSFSSEVVFLSKGTSLTLCVQLQKLKKVESHASWSFSVSSMLQELPEQVWDQVNYEDTIDWSQISSCSHLSARVDLHKTENTMFIV